MSAKSATEPRTSALETASRLEGKTSFGYARRFVVLACGIYLLTWVLSFFQVAFSGSSELALVWPACGLALYGLYRWGEAMWPAVYLPFLIGGVSGGNGWMFSIFGPVGVVLGLVWVVRSLKKKGFRPAIEESRDVVLLVGYGAVGMLFSGFWVAAWLVLGGAAPAAVFWVIGAVYWAAYSTGIMVLSPVLFLVATRGGILRGTEKEQPAHNHSCSDDDQGKKRCFFQLRDAAILLPLFGAGILGFSGVLSRGENADIWAYLPFPFLVWVGLTRGLPATASGIFGTVVLMVIFSLAGVGPFARGETIDVFFRAEIFLGVFSTTGLLIAAGAESRIRAAELREKLFQRDAELERIKAQIHPHFLFNCLGAIHSLVQTDTDRAQTGIVTLSELLRSSLDCAQEKVVPIEQELKFVENYLVLQKMRFEESLRATVIWGPEEGACLVPPVLIQPMVENAMKHGAEIDGQLVIEITAQKNNNQVEICVRNSVEKNSQLPDTWQDGVGLRSIKNRLIATWGEGMAAFSAQKVAPTLVETKLAFPFSTKNEDFDYR